MILFPFFLVFIKFKRTFSEYILMILSYLIQNYILKITFNISTFIKGNSCTSLDYVTIYSLCFFKGRIQEQQLN